MLRTKPKLAATLIVTLSVCGWAGTSDAAVVPILTPTDFILGGQSDGTDFTVGGPGSTLNTNNWPAAESPDHMIDGVGQKYLNFGKENTGAIITPSFGTSVVTSLVLWPANDAEPRDPASYRLFGTNAAITAAAPGDTVALSLFNLISEQAVTLPSDRNPGGSTPLSGTNFVTSTFANTAAYSSYLILFDALKDSGNANSMQIGEVQLHGVSPVPIPAAIWLLASGLGVLGWCGRARTPAGSC